MITAHTLFQNTMNEKEIFYQDKETCRIPLTHITENASKTPLREIDALYGAADVLSLHNAKRYRWILLLLSGAATLLTLAFLLYDEAELHGLIIACGVMLVCLFLIRRFADRLDCHRKYLEYRVLAESLRCQFFLSYAGIGASVAQLLPWSVRMSIPWVSDVLLTVSSQADTGDPHPVLDCWIREQKTYHQKALARTARKSRRDSRIAQGVLAVTIAAYIAALLYELILYRNVPGTGTEDLIRAVLKIILGTMSAVTLFTGSYYGKMSLSNAMDDHKRMIALYEMAEEEIQKNGENETLLLFLAREFLNENSTWYAYQSKNGPEIAI